VSRPAVTGTAKVRAGVEQTESGPVANARVAVAPAGTRRAEALSDGCTAEEALGAMSADGDVASEQQAVAACAAEHLGGEGFELHGVAFIEAPSELDVLGVAVGVDAQGGDHAGLDRFTFRTARS
jgi:hypothetical protein